LYFSHVNTRTIARDVEYKSAENKTLFFYF